MGDTRLRILIVGDRAGVPGGIQRLVNGEEDMRVIGVAVDGPDAIALVASLAPALVVLHLSIPDGHDLAIAASLLRQQPELEIVAIGSQREPGFVTGLVQGGIDGYVDQESAPAELASAIRAVVRGQRYVGITS